MDNTASCRPSKLHFSARKSRNSASFAARSGRQILRRVRHRQRLAVPASFRIQTAISDRKIAPSLRPLHSCEQPPGLGQCADPLGFLREIFVESESADVLLKKISRAGKSFFPRPGPGARRHCRSAIRRCRRLSGRRTRPWRCRTHRRTCRPRPSRRDARMR